MRTRSFFYSLLLLTASSPLFSLPNGFKTISGKAQLLDSDPSTMEIKMGKRAVIHWDSFNIQEKETVHFIMRDTHSVAFNHVMSGKASEILGKIQANGQVYLMNPKGVIIGKNAYIDTASFVASGFEVMNQGKIIAREGEIILKGNSVSDTGSIEALKSENRNGRIILLSNKEQTRELTPLIFERDISYSDPSPPHKTIKKEIQSTRYETAIATSEIFYDLSLYDNFRFTNWEYPNYFEEGSFAVVVANKGKTVEGKYLFMRTRHSFNKFIPYQFSIPEPFDLLAATTEKGPELNEGEHYIPLPPLQPTSIPSSE
jgi:filamentous hemagglutinin family protein